MSRFSVVLDACVLYPNLVRDFFMRLSMTGLFKARWTEKIHEEWISAYLENNPSADKNKVYKVKELLDRHAGDALIEGFEEIERQINLPDPDDRHVLAAAIRANADAIVTFNTKDFPPEALEPYAIEAIHPDDFIQYQIDLSPPKVCEALRAMRLALKNPPFSEQELITALAKNQLPVSSSILSEYIGSF